MNTLISLSMFRCATSLIAVAKVGLFLKLTKRIAKKICFFVELNVKNETLRYAWVGNEGTLLYVSFVFCLIRKVCLIIFPYLCLRMHQIYYI